MHLRIGRKPAAFLALAALAMAGLVVACGGDDDDDGGGAGATPTAGPAGSIAVSSSVITGQKGKGLLVFAAPSGGGPIARACVQITADSFTLASTLLTDFTASGDPCSGSTATAKLPKGTYTVSAGIYVPPAQSPEKQTTQTVEAGEAAVAVSFDGKALSK